MSCIVLQQAQTDNSIGEMSQSVEFCARIYSQLTQKLRGEFLLI